MDKKKEDYKKKPIPKELIKALFYNSNKTAVNYLKDKTTSN
jgi:hypothetical protein